MKKVVLTDTIEHQTIKKLIEYLKHNSTDGTTEKNKLREELKEITDSYFML